ncbi:hypothetical protein P8605_22635, partial [Streptomyces sp. T-3]|nr:hypothetical protein [Streptomyces sp. T-3]
MALITFNSPYPTGLFRGVPGRVWQGRLLVGAGAALLPWMGYLAATLPPAQALAWIALDSAEAACLLFAGRSLVRGDGRHRVT